MMKPLLIAALAIVGLTFATESAQAGRRCCRNRCFSACNTCNTCNTCNSCSTGCNACATGCNASGAYQTAPVTDPNTAPPPPQTTSNGYQSYSYEPGTAVINTPASSVRMAPQAIQSTPSSFQFRGDRKALGVVY